MGNCGISRVLVSRVKHNYMGVVKNSFELGVGDSLKFVLSGLWVIEHPFPLFLLGANFFFGGWKVPSWNYEGIFLKTNSDTCTVSVSVKFRRKA